MPKIVQGPWKGRATEYKLWEPLWAGLAAKPTAGQERLIAELVAELRALARWLGHPDQREPAAWLLGFCKQAELDWPPEKFSRLIAALKAKKKQLKARGRRKNAITAAQRRKLWAIVGDAALPGIDKDLMYWIIREEYPSARRPGPDGVAVPSLSSLTTAEARRLIDTLINPAGQASQRRPA